VGARRRFNSFNARIAQMYRVKDFYSLGWGLESLCGYQKKFFDKFNDNDVSIA
jgi:hypothetical protein